MKNQWPPVKAVKNHGKTRFMVDCRINGKGERKYFDTRADAKAEAATQRVKRINEGTDAFDDSALRKYGWNVARAVAFALEHLRKQEKTVPLKTAVTDFLAAKKGTGLSLRYQNDLKLRLTRFKDAHPEATTGTVTTATVNDFLRGLNLHPTTANTFRRDLNTFFAWCVDGGLCQTNPAAKATIYKAKPEPITTLSAAQLDAMLAAAEDCIRPAVVLAGFCALRQAEIARLDWRNVDLKERVVTLDAGTTKTNSRRVVTMPLAAVAWLAPLAKDKKAGPILTPGPDARAAWDLCRLAAGFGPFNTSLLRSREAQKAMTKDKLKALVPWPDNALRHTAISARMALAPEDTAKAFDIPAAASPAITGIEAVAFQAGNSPQVIKTHYLRLMKPDEARKWFAVAPPAPAKNVVPYRRTA